MRPDGVEVFSEPGVLGRKGACMDGWLVVDCMWFVGLPVSAGLLYF